MHAYPNDDIKFIFQEKINASTSENRMQQKEEVLNRMFNFEVIKQSHCGVADNCIYELEKYAAEEMKILNFK
jgi:hypothetical protein